MYVDRDAAPYRARLNPKFAKSAQRKQRAREPKPVKTHQDTLAEIFARAKALASEAHGCRLLNHEKPSPQGLILKAANEHGVSYQEIMSKRRSKPITRARWAAIRAVADEYPSFTENELGKLFGIDTSSARYALEKTRQPGATR